MRVVNPQSRSSPEIRIGEEPKYIRQRCARLVQKSEERVSKDMFKSRSPRIGPDFFECVQQPRCGERSLFGRNVLQRIKSKRILDVRNVEKDQILFSLFWHRCKDFLDQISVRIEER